ncbi:hypothetical protein CKO11_16315 [Rhodobacter sp. TJ_12]|uniref:hypothetical protein n=1 Tax=Rhodobacter sp. TJ_12 TaxID=2029399 RepID=UPI001CBE297B|nr:hypothetical protein [Rhodobacter sp. TJ_12]MBZ4024016.1 hypothetical protein [Rhodobacter sp. TJ_12]
MHENKLNDLIMSRAKSREQQVIEKFQIWESPRLVRAVSEELRDIENRAFLDAADSLARIYSKMSMDGRNMYEFEKLRKRLSNQSDLPPGSSLNLM